MKTLSQKFDEVMNSGLAFQIFNKPEQESTADYLWGIKIFWRLMEYDGQKIVEESYGFENIEDCLDDALKFLEFRDKIYSKTKGPETPLMQSEDICNVDVWDWVVDKNGCVIQVTDDDMPELPFEDIKRFATKMESENADKINDLLNELIKEKASNKASWDMYGSELCAGDMINKEDAIRNKIKELRNYAGN